MATKSKSSANKDTPDGGIFSAFPAAFMANLPNTPMNGSANWWQAYMTGAAEMNSEFMRFVATRLQHDVELGQSIAKCRDWNDAANLHKEWMRQMSEEYMNETETMIQIASTTAQESWNATTGGSNDDRSQPGESSDK